MSRASAQVAGAARRPGRRAIAPRPAFCASTRRSRRRYGPHRWWPGRSPYEIAVGAVLTSTHLDHAARAIAGAPSRRTPDVRTAGGLGRFPSRDHALGPGTTA